MGQQRTAIMLDKSDGKFGPFAGQFFVADYTLSIVMRADMEKVNGVYQGACFPFRQGFATGFIGGTLTDHGQTLRRRQQARLAGARAGREGPAAARLVRQNAVRNPHRRAKPDGFELRFTTPVDAKTASDPASYTLETFTHHYFAAYGGPEIEQADQRSPRLHQAPTA